MENCITHFVTIICPVYNEEIYISKCIESIINQDYHQDKLEIIFIDGMSKDDTRKIVRQYCNKYSNVKLLDNPERIVSYALNKGIKASKGDVIIRLDAHCYYPANYISTLVKKLYELNADNVGAVCRTLPAKDNSQSWAVAIVSSHRFGVGNSLFRVGVDKITEADTVPFGCFKADIFKRIGLFDNDLVRNQDDEFNARIIKNGGKIYLIPELIIDYFARDKISKMAKMFYQYGFFKPLVNRKIGSVATLRQFFPLFFLLGVVGGGVLSLFFKQIMWIYFIVIFFYFWLGLLFGTKSAIEHHNWKVIFLMPVTFFVIHISYGWGYLKGIYRIVIGSKNQCEIKINR